jgi:hypothetical protein
LRRGFASWASANGWEMRALMEYVGWKNVSSASRYVDSPDPYHREMLASRAKDNSSHPSTLSNDCSISDYFWLTKGTDSALYETRCEVEMLLLSVRILSRDA